LIFNECADLGHVFEAIELGFGLVMFTDDQLRLAGADGPRARDRRAGAPGVDRSGRRVDLAARRARRTDERRRWS